MATYTSERYVETQLNESVLLGISAVISVIYTVIKLIARLLIPPMDRSDIEKEGKVLKDYTKKLETVTNNDKVTVYAFKESKPEAFYAGGNSIFVSTGLTRLLNEKETMGVICHEYGHYKKKHMVKDTSFMTIAAFSILGITTPLFIYARSILGGWTFIAYILTNLGLSRLVNSIYDRTVGKKYELQADSYAKKLGYGKELKSALVKLDKFYGKILCKNLSKEECKLLVDPPASDPHPTTDVRAKNLLMSLMSSPRKILSFMRTRKSII